MGLSVRPPSVAQSLAKWIGNGKEMRVGLSAIKDLGCETVRRIVDQRKLRGFAGVDDFLRRIRPDEREVRALINSGALDDLEPVTLAGWLVTGKTVATKHGDPMKFLTFEDETDIFETVFFPRAFERFFPILDYGRPYLVTGHVDESFGAYTLNVNFLRGLY